MPDKIPFIIWGTFRMQPMNTYGLASNANRCSFGELLSAAVDGLARRMIVAIKPLWILSNWPTRLSQV